MKIRELNLHCGECDIIDYCPEYPNTPICAQSSLDIHVYQEDYNFLFTSFINLGEMLGFTWDQVEKAYLAKNEVNHARQETGY